MRHMGSLLSYAWLRRNPRQTRVSLVDGNGVLFDKEIACRWEWCRTSPEDRRLNGHRIPKGLHNLEARSSVRKLSSSKLFQARVLTSLKLTGGRGSCNWKTEWSEISPGSPILMNGPRNIVPRDHNVAWVNELARPSIGWARTSPRCHE